LAGTVVLAIPATDADAQHRETRAQRRHRLQEERRQRRLDEQNKDKPKPPSGVDVDEEATDAQNRAKAAREAANEAAEAAERAEAIAVVIEREAKAAIAKKKAADAAREAAAAKAKAEAIAARKNALRKEKEESAAAAEAAAKESREADDENTKAEASAEEARQISSEAQSRKNDSGYARGSNNSLLDNAVDDIEQHADNDELESTKPVNVADDNEWAVKVGGFVRLLGDYDHGALGRYRFQFQVIPTDDQPQSKSRQNMRLHARQTRVFLESKYKSPIGPVKTYIEFDFQGGGGNENVSNSASPRIRHAYGQAHGITMGQTWSAFTDVSSFPETANSTITVGVAFIRQALIKGTYKVGKLSGTLGIENAQTVTNVAVAIRARPGSDPYPDITGNLRYDHDKESHVQLSGVGRRMSVVSNSDVKVEAFGWGAAATMKVKLHKMLRIGGGVSGGEGIGRYILVVGAKGEEGVAAFLGGSGPDSVELRPATDIAGYGWIQFRPIPKLHLNAVYGHFHSRIHEIYAGQEGGIPDGVNYELKSAHGSAFYHMSPSVTLGSEVIWGHRETYNSQGKNLRVGLNAKFKF